jgi:transcriptional regulator with XRE-family HTH domain
MTLGERLRELRVRGPNGYCALRPAAVAVGCLFVEWSHFENDREKPSPEMLARIAACFGGDIDELLRLREEWQEAPPTDLSRSICNGRRLQP